VFPEIGELYANKQNGVLSNCSRNMHTVSPSFPSSGCDVMLRRTPSQLKVDKLCIRTALQRLDQHITE